MRPTDDELEAMAVRLEDRCDSGEIGHQIEAAAMLRACKGRVQPTTWHVDESEHSVLIYSLKQDGWRKGEPVMVNDLTIRIENANGSTNDLKPFAEAILTALDPDYSDWNAAIEAAAKVADACKTQNQKIGASDYQKGLASAGQAVAHAIRLLKKGPPQ